MEEQRSEGVMEGFSEAPSDYTVLSAKQCREETPLPPLGEWCQTKRSMDQERPAPARSENRVDLQVIRY